MGDLNFGEKALDVLLGAGGNLIDSIGSAIFGNELGKANSDKLWNERYSPQAQVRNLAAAGINPAVAMGNNSPVLSAGGEINPVPVSPFGIGTSSLAEIGSYLNAIANAKKAGADTRLSEEEVKLKQIEVDLQKTYAKPNAIANLMSAYKNLRAQDDEHSLKEWQISKEKFLSSLSGIQRDTAQKVLDNMDYQIQQENKQREEDIKLTQEKQKTEKSGQSANYASAKASVAAADLSKKQADYQQIVNDIKESGKTFELENLIRKWQAENKVADASAEQAYTMLNRYKQLNENDKNKAARYLNYAFWFIKEQMPNLPIVPFLKLGK